MPGKAGRRTWGHVHKERSGRYTARVPVADAPGQYRSIGTYASEKLADDALSIERARVVGGTWVDPAKGEQRLATYAAQFISTNGYKARTLALQTRVRTEWIAVELALVIASQPPRIVDIGSLPLRAITAQNVRDWHTAVKAEARRRAVERKTNGARSPAKIARAIREWAAEEDLDVAATGRIPATVRQAWERAGGMRMIPVDIPPTAGERRPHRRTGCSTRSCSAPWTTG